MNTPLGPISSRSTSRKPSTVRPLSHARRPAAWQALQPAGNTEVALHRRNYDLTGPSQRDTIRLSIIENRRLVSHQTIESSLDLEKLALRHELVLAELATRDPARAAEAMKRHIEDLNPLPDRRPRPAQGG